MSLWVGQTSDICAKPVAKTRQSNHTSRHTSNRPCSLIFRTTPHFSPDFITIADPLPDPPSLFAPRACLSRVHSRFRSAARLSPIFPSRPLRSCTCSLSYLASPLLISIVRSATVYQYTESASKRKLDKFPSFMERSEEYDRENLIYREQGELNTRIRRVLSNNFSLIRSKREKM